MENPKLMVESMKRSLLLYEHFLYYEIAGAEIFPQETKRVFYSCKWRANTASELIQRFIQKYRIHDLSVWEPKKN